MKTLVTLDLSSTRALLETYLVSIGMPTDHATLNEMLECSIELMYETLYGDAVRKPMTSIPQPLVMCLSCYFPEATTEEIVQLGKILVRRVIMPLLNLNVIYIETYTNYVDFVRVLGQKE